MGLFCNNLYQVLLASAEFTRIYKAHKKCINTLIPELLDDKLRAVFTLFILMEGTLEAGVIVVDTRGQILGHQCLTRRVSLPRKLDKSNEEGLQLVYLQP